MQDKINPRLQMVCCLIPIVNIWAFYRIHKLLRSSLFIAIPSTIIHAILINIGLEPMTTVLPTTQATAITFFVSIHGAVTIGFFILSMYLINKWTKEFNKHEFNKQGTSHD